MFNVYIYDIVFNAEHILISSLIKNDMSIHSIKKHTLVSISKSKPTHVNVLVWIDTF